MKGIAFVLLLLLGFGAAPQASAAALPEAIGMAQLYQEKAELERQRIEKYRARMEGLNGQFSGTRLASRQEMLQKLSDYYDTMISNARRKADRYDAMAKAYLHELQIARLLQTSA